MPLLTHLADCAHIGGYIWDNWLSEGIKRLMAQSIPKKDAARSLYVFLCAAHDIGKSVPVFQAKNSSHLPTDLDLRITENLTVASLPIQRFQEFAHPQVTPHALATQLILMREGFNENIGAILGAHHGRPASSYQLSFQSIEAHPTNYHMGQSGKKAWTSVQRALIQYALRLSGFKSANDLPTPNMPAQALLSGLLIMADWIASNERLFPYIRIEDDARHLDSGRRACAAWRALNLPPAWIPENLYIQPTELYKARFCFAPRTTQMVAAELASRIFQPGICIVEASTGSGKTEIALAAAEAFAGKSRRSGLFFTLPTQATSDAIFPRVRSWVDSLADGRHAMALAHSKAQFNEGYRLLFEGGREIYEETGGAFVHSWFEGQKKALLADFVVGTIDQLLMMALKQKHVMLRHLGLANKVVIIDECHAYDAYMNEYLDMALKWLGAYKVPVIILSATLPAKRRQALVEAYLNTPKPASLERDFLRRGKSAAPKIDEWAVSRSYPLLTFTDDSEIHSLPLPSDEQPRHVHISYMDEAMLPDKLSGLLADGGCAGVIVNTVRRAQDIARAMRSRFGSEQVRLLHARFLSSDRAENEAALLRLLGKPPKSERPHLCIVVGTQVLEQSLDIDFDVLITDLCPMDLLIQRMGRMHRHMRDRAPGLRNPMCFILTSADGGMTEGTTDIYKRYPLMRTRALLPERILLPCDVPSLVQDVYDDNAALPYEPPLYAEAREEWFALTARKERRADTFRICPPWLEPTATLVGWLSAGVESLHEDVSQALSEQAGEAKVRDGDESFEVILLVEAKGAPKFLPWVEGGQTIPIGAITYNLAQALARQRIRMPRPLCTPWMIQKTIAELEELNAERFAVWRDSPWLNGELFLPMDERLTAKLNGYVLRYDRLDGMSYEKEEN